MGGRLVNNLPPIYISLLYTDTSIELRTILLPFWTSVASTDSLVTLSRMLASNACPGFQFGLADFTAAYIAALYCPSYCSKVHVPLKRLQAYENHSNFMATSTEIWSELQDFTPSVVYHKGSEQTANEQNIGENQENTAKSKEKGVIKNSA